MTVSELIEKLQKFKGNTIVCLTEGNNVWYDIEASNRLSYILDL